MRPDCPGTKDLSRGADPSVTQTEGVSDREFFHRFISADRAEPGPEPAFVLLHDSGENEEDLLSIVEAGAEDGKANVIALRGLFEYGNQDFRFWERHTNLSRRSLVFIDRADEISRFLALGGERIQLGSSEDRSSSAPAMELRSRSLCFLCIRNCWGCGPDSTQIAIPPEAATGFALLSDLADQS